MHLRSTAVSALLVLAPLASAHGILVNPAPREGQGIAPGPKFAVFPPPADLMALCGSNNNAGPVSATFTAGETVPVKWAVTIGHVSAPGVTISIKYNPNDPFEVLAKGLDVDTLTASVKLPADKFSENAVLQWTWASQEDGGFYLECADIAVKPAAKAPEAPKPPVTEAPAPKPPVVEAPAPKPPVVEVPAPKPPVVEAPAPKPPVVEAPAPKPPVVEAPAPPVVEAPAPKPPVVDAPVPSPPVVIASAPEAPVVVAASQTTSAVETGASSAPTAEATGVAEADLPDCIPEPVQSPSQEPVKAPAPEYPGPEPAMPETENTLPKPSESAPGPAYPQTVPETTGSASTEQPVFSSAFSSKAVTGVLSAFGAGIAALALL
ncbi:hypothetical protein HDU86_000274 [Geranomyces michiganensis]|nr:hypothetical protein HDU86_000274 [Geranomyces michiganensis]